MRRADEVPYRLLEHVSSHGDPSAGNLLIQGDNLEALKALLPLYRGRVKCIYIDPPYNTKSAFEHYDDNLEHSQWLSMMYPRLMLLRELLSEEGSIWASIDDNEGHYLKVLMDEVFGRRNFIHTMVWQQRTTRENRKVFSNNHEYVMLFARDATAFERARNALPLSETVRGRYKNPDNDPRGPWQSVSLNAQAGHATPNQFYVLVAPNGKQHTLPKGRCWLLTELRLKEEIQENNVWFGKNGNGVPRLKKFLSEANRGLTPETLWFAEEVGTNDQAKKDTIRFFGDAEVFDTPKPERLIERVIRIATNPGEIVLDSFLGSGTTAAVAHKLNRRYIGVEMGAHAATHCLPRLEKVIEGEQGGISESVGWKGGGGFQFLKLGETVFDEAGAINPKVRFATLASFIWLQETGHAASQRFKSPLLGAHNGTGYYLLFNGILGDKRPDGGNVLTGLVLSTINKKFPHRGPKVIYGESSRLGNARLEAADITFKHIPYDVKAR